MIALIVQSLLFLALPLLAITLAHRVKALSWLSPVLLAYLFGMVLANTPGLPVDAGLSDTFTQATVPLAIPLLLFSTDFVGWVRYARSAVVSFVIACVSVGIMAFVGGLLFATATDETWKIAGMLVGVYTGGTPNLLSIGLALDVRQETYILLNAADVVVSGVYLLFLLSIAKSFLGKFLPAFRPQGADAFQTFSATHTQGASTSSRPWRGMLLGFGLSVLILAASVGVALAVRGEMDIAWIILGITTLGIAASFVPRIRTLPATESLGNYLILVFCVAIGSLTNFSLLFQSGGTILAITAFVVAGTLVLHYGLCALFRIDVDTAIITSTAAIFGPAFVPPMAEALDNKTILLSGLTTGLVGYAVANYLGIAVAYLLR
ncbi:MAG: DUF819 family protein [Caldilineaceae bacterium]|nr:DUF819 family protein [Caldilineaceae bacterium]MBP9072390.1 DUF819 family protein [Caldilineaceae bacterium]